MLEKEAQASLQRRHHGKALSEGVTDAEKVGFRNALAQKIRFEAATRVMYPDGDFSVLDFGCGLGNMSEHLPSRAKYTGLDVLDEMIVGARERYPGMRFHSGTLNELHDAGERFDVVYGCGLWGEKFHDRQHEEIFDFLRVMWDMCDHSIMFTVPSRYSDKDDGWRVTFTPELMFGWCHSQLGERVMVDHTFLPHVFAVYVYKQPSDWRVAGNTPDRPGWPPKV
jgi:SAM-dependent methyltransferase